MEWADLNSNGFKRVGYDEELKQLHVRTEDGKYIIYYEVRESDYVGMYSSRNMREFYENNIVNRFPYTEVSQ
ncbi:KTSC domain-containing protein [Bacillus daqingensis]|uniref:KTSC domain-containing protein n=2 Tax=Bacillaceae TaxID=186817 RepID=A0A969PM95_9BACI|nr:KTSC domain-containing protein [Alkalicoccus luteus]NJP36792.1 KTSC domain-containing protein [Alkalicoccus luteus]